MKVEHRRDGLAAYLRSHEHPGGIIICERLKFIYMKPTKTAGSSILRARLEKQISGIVHHKDHPEQYEEWFERITDEALEEYYIFSVVRNPWDRLVSVAAYFKIPFKRFLDNIHDYRKDDDIRIHTLPLSLYTHFGGACFVDFIGRFECLQADMNLVSDRLGLARERLPFINWSKHDHYSRYYDPEDVQRAAALYQGDIDNFGYMFEAAAHGDEGEGKGFLSRVAHGLTRLKR